MPSIRMAPLRLVGATREAGCAVREVLGVALGAVPVLSPRPCVGGLPGFQLKRYASDEVKKTWGFFVANQK